MSDYVAGFIRQSFHELLQSHGVSIYSEGPRSKEPVTQAQLSGLLDLVIEAVGAEIASRHPVKPEPEMEFHTPACKSSWTSLKKLAQRERVVFQVKGIQATFYLGPDIFPDSWGLAWETHDEIRNNAFADHRIRSNDPDDFLSRFREMLEETSP